MRVLRSREMMRKMRRVNKRRRAAEGNLGVRGTCGIWQGVRVEMEFWKRERETEELCFMLLGRRMDGSWQENPLASELARESAEGRDDRWELSTGVYTGGKEREGQREGEDKGGWRENLDFTMWEKTVKGEGSWWVGEEEKEAKAGVGENLEEVSGELWKHFLKLS